MKSVGKLADYKKSSRLRKPRTKKANMIYIHLQVDFICKVKENYTIIYVPRLAR